MFRGSSVFPASSKIVVESSQFCVKVNTALKTAVFFLSGLLLFPAISLSRVRAGEAVRLYEFGADEMAYLALPAQAPKGSVLLIPDALGTPEVVAARCDLLAKLGFVAMTVDFYNGQTAGTLEKGRSIQARLSAENCRKTIAAALKLLTVSPQYRSDKLVVGVWGSNMSFLREVLVVPGNQANLVALSWFEPEGSVLEDPFAGLPRPLQVLANNGPWMGEWEKAQAARPLKRIPADIHRYKAAPGFLLKADTDDLAAQAWVSVIEFWKEAVERSAPASETRPEGGPAAEVEEAPARPAPQRSSILPKR